MKRLILSVVLAASLATAAAPALAQPINGRESNEQHRIDQGVRSGQLTPREAAHDERGLAQIDRRADRLRDRQGGHLTWRQRARMEHRLNHESRRIYRTRHNHRHD